MEAELKELEPEEAAEYLQSLGVEEAGLGSLIRATYRQLGLQTYFTSGPTETRAWTIRTGTSSLSMTKSGRLRGVHATVCCICYGIFWQKYSCGRRYVRPAGCWRHPHRLRAGFHPCRDRRVCSMLLCTKAGD